MQGIPEAKGHAQKEERKPARRQASKHLKAHPRLEHTHTQEQPSINHKTAHVLILEIDKDTWKERERERE